MRQVVFSPAAVRQYQKLPAAARSLLKKEIDERLAQQDATEENRNRFRLRRFSPHSDFELRVDPWRVFYRVSDDLVIVELIGRKQGNALFVGRKGVQSMKIESLREVKAKLSKIVKRLPVDKSVVITKNGRPCAVLLPVTEETDLETLLLAQRKDFWRMFDRAHEEGEKKGFTKLEDLVD